MADETTSVARPDKAPKESLLEQFVDLAEHLAMDQGGTIVNSNTSTQTVAFLGRNFTVTEEVTEKITVTPA